MRGAHQSRVLCFRSAGAGAPPASLPRWRSVCEVITGPGGSGLDLHPLGRGGGSTASRTQEGTWGRGPGAQGHGRGTWGQGGRRAQGRRGRAPGAGARAWDPGQDMGPGGGIRAQAPACPAAAPHHPLAPLSGVLWLLVSLGSWSDHPRPGQRGGQGEASPAVLHRARGRDSLFLRLAQPEL